MFSTFFPILVLFLIVVVTIIIMMFLPEMLAKKTMTRRKASPYECGIIPETDARDRFPIKFYMIAILFIVFDLEMVFLYPWAIILKKLKMFAARRKLVMAHIWDMDMGGGFGIWWDPLILMNMNFTTSLLNFCYTGMLIFHMLTGTSLTII